jgi:hypothetical protein
MTTDSTVGTVDSPSASVEIGLFGREEFPAITRK